MKTVLCKESKKIHYKLNNNDYIKQAGLQHDLQTLCFNAGLGLWHPAFAFERYHSGKEKRAPIH